MIRAEQPQIDMRALPRELLDHVLVNLVNVLDAEVTPRYSGLVGHHRHWNLCPVQRGDRLNRAVYELDAVNRADVSIVGYDRSVTIKQCAWSAHHRPPSAR